MVMNNLLLKSCTSTSNKCQFLKKNHDILITQPMNECNADVRSGLQNQFYSTVTNE